MSTTTDLKIGLRWMTRGDLKQIITIEHACWSAPWTEEEFTTVQRQVGCAGQVAVYSHRVVGYWLMQRTISEINLIHFCVSPEYRRMGVGRQIVDCLKDSLSLYGCRRITIDIRESNTDAHLFFASQGFRATAVLREHYSDTGEDAYLFEYAL